MISDQEETVLSKRLYFDEPEKWLSCFSKRIRSDKRLKINSIKNGVILPIVNSNPYFMGGVCDENFNFIAGQLHISNKEGPQLWVYKSYTISDQIKYIDESVVFGGVMFDHPGHLIYECISNRLWWHIINPGSKLKIAFCPSWGNKKWIFIKEMLQLAGVPDDKIILIEKPTKFKEVLVPDQSVYPSSYFTDEYTYVVNHIKGKIVPGKFKKVYFTRRKVAKQDIINEEYFVNFFEKRGYKIIDPEDYSIAEKASIMYGAEEVASLIGTNTHYCAFCKPTVRLIMLARCGEQVSPEQAIINEAFGIKDIYIIDVSLSFLHKHRTRGICLIGVTAQWKAFVKDYFDYDILDEKDDALKKNLYGYLKRCAEYYSDPKMFNHFKNFDHFSIVNSLNEVFLGKKLDEKKYNNANASDQLFRMTNAKNFFENLLYDFSGQAIFIRYIQTLNNRRIALLQSADAAGKFLLHLLKQNNIEVVFQTQKNTLPDLTNDEWLKCRSADVVICCCVHGAKPVERDGIKPIMIWDILKEPALPASDYKGLVAYDDLAQAILAEIKSLKEDAEKNASTQQSEIKLLRTENNRMSTELSRVNADIGRFSGENKQLIERLNAASERSEALLQEHDSLNKTVVRLESEVSRLENDLSATSAQSRKLNAALSEVSLKLEAANAENQSLNGENKQLIERLNAADIRSETLIKDQNSLNMTIARLESEVDRLEVDLNSVSILNDTLTIDLRGVSSNLEAANAQLELLNSEKDRLVLEARERDNAIRELQNKIAEMEHSRSWRITKPLRAIMWFFRRLFGKIGK